MLSEWAGEGKNNPEKAKYPAQPEGRGALLEWYQGKAGDSALGGVFVSILVIIVGILKDGGFGWMATWWLWIFVIAPPFVWYLYGRAYGISAGADWFAVKGGYVDTYDLVEVKLVGASGGLAWDLELKDKKGTEISVNLREVQANRDLWDLVYNGIAHSVHRGAKTNQRALDKLKLR